jgi:hypothetical protein
MATGVERVIDQYIAGWNETNPGAHRELIARTRCGAVSNRRATATMEWSWVSKSRA